MKVMYAKCAIVIGGTCAALISAASAQPANDSNCSAIGVSVFPAVTAPVDITNAAPAPEFNTCPAPGMFYSIWYKLYANDNGVITVSTCSPDAPDCTIDDTIVTVFQSGDGSCTALTPSSCADDNCDIRRSRVQVICNRDHWYYIQAGKSGSTPPAPGTALQLYINAPLPANPPQAFCAATPDPVSNCADAPVLIEVYTTPGSNPTSTQLSVTCDLSALGGSPSTVCTDDATGGDRIAGDGVFSTTRTIPAGATPGSRGIIATVTDEILRQGTSADSLRIIGCRPPPANDVCIGAIDVTAPSGNLLSPAVPMLGAAFLSENSCGIARHSLWFKFTPHTSGTWTISTCPAAAPARTVPDTVLDVYSSTSGSCGSLFRIGCDYNSCGGGGSVVEAHFRSDTTYYIQAGSQDNSPPETLEIMQVAWSAPPPAPPGAWAESGDAGDLPLTAQVPQGSGDLTAITGEIDNTNIDMYELNICDEAAFSASTVGGALFDTQLWLFDETGRGVSHSDNTAENSQSRITSQFVQRAGLYYLAISRYNRDARDSQGRLIWNSTPDRVERAPDGTGAQSPLASWLGPTSTAGLYRIALTGTCFPGGQCPPCTGDFNSDGGIDGADVNFFFSTWEAGEACADVNQDGGIDGSDVQAFFPIWEDGRCE